ncbi:hypothetical protein [Phenylobacterium sp.]|jgi:hypothetical protein|uniref:hypothetical protein n=1 Tax=Phenylobacterium sp. TaxID=1871053 RepID=UPI002F419F5B
MPHWLGTLLAILTVVAIALLIGWLSTTGGRRRMRRYGAMGSMLLGFGMVFEPPARHAVEASERRVARGDENGDPPDPEV